MQPAVRELVPSSSADDELMTELVVAAAMLTLVLAGMCAHTALFVRWKRVAR